MAQPNRSPTRLPMPSTQKPGDDKENGPSRPVLRSRRGLSDLAATAPSLRPNSISEASGTKQKPVERVRGRALTGASSVTQERGIGRPVEQGSNGDDNKLEKKSIAPVPGLSRTRSIRAPGSYGATTASQEADRKAMPPPPMGLSRTRSVRAPGTQEAAKGPPTRTHTRNQSITSTKTVPRPMSMGKKPEGSETPTPPNGSRPPSSASTMSRTSTEQKTSSSRIGFTSTRSNSPSAASTTSKASVEPSRITRSMTSGHARHASTTSAGLQRAGSTATRHSRAASTASTTSSLASIQNPSLARPAFSTLQQHYSPRKGPSTKPPVPTGKSLFADTSSYDVSSSEVVQLQTELLQLHLLHASSGNIQQQWQRSAERALMERFQETANQHRAMRDREHMLQKRINLSALQGWDSGVGLPEKLSILGGLLQELPALVDTDGRYSRLVNSFERWLTWVEEVRSARETQAVPNGVEFVEGLGDAWKAEHAYLYRKVASLSRQCQELDVPAEGSTLAITVRECKGLTRGILDELAVMDKIEKAVAENERAWVEEALEGIEGDIETALRGEDQGRERLPWIR